MMLTGTYVAGYLAREDYPYPYQTGSHGSGISNYDDLWNQMYIAPKPVIIVCGYCKSHNVVSSPTCIQCGAPMGAGFIRSY